MTAAEREDEAADLARAWEEHELSQLRYFRSLPLRERMAAVQGMCDVLRHFARMRAQGKFKPGA
ncbi:MAG: hypothetical protein ACT4P4_29425 [Betaproteobacteria bacterium]